MARHPTMVQLTEETRALLDEHAARARLSRSEVIRRAVHAYLAESAEAVTSRRIREGYERLPETASEVDHAMAGARRLLEDPDLPW